VEFAVSEVSGVVCCAAHFIVTYNLYPWVHDLQVVNILWIALSQFVKDKSFFISKSQEN